MRHMKHKNDVLHLRIDEPLLEALNALARRMGDQNTSAIARLAMRVGVAAMQEKPISEIVAIYAGPQEANDETTNPTPIG